MQTGKERKTGILEGRKEREGSVPSLLFRLPFPSGLRSVPVFRWCVPVSFLCCQRSAVPFGFQPLPVSFPFPSLCCAALPSRFRFRFRPDTSGKERKGHRKRHRAKQGHGVGRKRIGTSRYTGGRGGGNRHFVHSFTLQGPTFPHSQFRSLLTFKGGAFLSVPNS